jgi:hypothetical protein
MSTATSGGDYVWRVYVYLRRVYLRRVYLRRHNFTRWGRTRDCDNRCYFSNCNIRNSQSISRFNRSWWQSGHNVYRPDIPSGLLSKQYYCHVICSSYPDRQCRR